MDRTNHHLFQPLLYQVAAGGLSEGQIASAIRVLLKRQPNVSVLMAEATDVDVDATQASLDTGEELPYDSLILACGAETSYFGNEEWKDVTFGLKTLATSSGCATRSSPPSRRPSGPPTQPPGRSG